MDIARAAGRRIIHKPMDLDKVVPASGSPPFSERSDNYRQYFFKREIQRWSEQRRAPVMGRPTHHHKDITLANCLLIAGMSTGLDIDALTHALLEAHWRYDADLSDESTLTAIAVDAGYDAAALLSNARTNEVQRQYQANNQEAIARSVFGSPTYFADGDMFYG